MCRNIPKLLMAPAEAITVAKKKASYGDALGTLIVDGIIAAVTAAILLTQLGDIPGISALLGGQFGTAVVSMFVIVLIGGLFFALLTKLVVNTLGGNGDYLHGLTASAYTMVAPIVGLLVASIFFRVQYNIGPLIVFIAMSIGIALGLSTLYRSIKELFATDLLTALVAVLILTSVITATFTFVSTMISLTTAATAVV